MSDDAAGSPQRNHNNINIPVEAEEDRQYNTTGTTADLSQTIFTFLRPLFCTKHCLHHLIRRVGRLSSFPTTSGLSQTLTTCETSISLDGAASFQRRQDDGDCGLGVTGVVDLRAADGDWRGGLGGDAVAKASHVALWGSDLKVVAGVGLKVRDDCLSQTSVHLHLQSVVLHLEDGRGLVELEGKDAKGESGLVYLS